MQFVDETEDKSSLDEEDFELDLENGLDDSGEDQTPVKKKSRTNPRLKKGELRALVLGKRESDERPAEHGKMYVLID